MAQAAALGEAKVSIRASFEALQGDLDKAAQIVEKTFSQTGRTLRNVGAALTAGVTVPIAALIAKSTLAAGRVSELSAVNTLLGETAGYSSKYVKDQTQAVIDQGIEAAAANTTIAEFIKSNLDIADAAKVSRIAQDAAVISGQNSTEVTEQLTQAIITGRTQLFKSAGILLDLNKAYDEYGETIGKSGRQLSEQEKLQARVNATIEYGTRISGAYTTAMEEPSKALRSFPRYFNEIFVAMGEYFQPAFKVAVDVSADFLKEIRGMVSEGGSLAPLLERWGDLALSGAEKFGKLLDKIQNLNPWVLDIIGTLVEFAAVMGPVLLAGGSVIMMVGKMIGVFNGLSSAIGISSTALFTALGPYAALAAILAGVGIAAAALGRRQKRLRDAHLKSAEIVAMEHKSYQDYKTSMQEAAKEEGMLIDQHGNLVDIYGRVQEAHHLLTEAQWERKHLTGEQAEMEEAYQRSLIATEEAVIEAAEAEERLKDLQKARMEAILGGEMGQEIEDYRESLGDLNTELLETKLRIGELVEKRKSNGGWLGQDDQEELDELTTKFGEIKTSIKEVEEAHREATKQIIFDIFSQQIAMSELPFEDQIAAIGEIAKSWGLADEATTLVWDETAKLVGKLEEGKLKVDELGDAMDRINDKVVDFELRTRVTGGGASILGGGNWTQGGFIKEERAIGGPVLGGRPYLVGERGPELYVPRGNGEIISNHKMRNFSDDPGPSKNIENNYNLTMHGNNNPEDVILGFDFMMAYGGS